MKNIRFIFLLVAAISAFGAIPPHIPETNYGLIYFPCDFTGLGTPFHNFANALRTIWCAHGDTIELGDYIVGRPPGDPGNVIFDYFFDDCLNTGKHGYINIFSHGCFIEGQSWLAVEFYLTEQEAIIRRNALSQKYNAWGLIKHGVTPEGFWCVIISAEFFRMRITNLLPFSLYFINACHSAEGSPSVVQSFIERGGECGFGWSEAVGGLAVQAPISIFYRMGGRNFSGDGLAPVIQDELRNKSADEAKTEYDNPYLVLLGNPAMKMYNSPRIIQLEVKQAGKLIYQYTYGGGDYPGDLSNCPKEPAVVCAQPLEIEIQFSSPMNPASAHVAIMPEQGTFAIPVSGNWSSVIFDNDLWIGACDFSEWSGGENAIVSVDAEDAFVGDINAKLDTDGDGNSDGEDKNHKFKVELPPQVISTDPADGEEGVDVV